MHHFKKKWGQNFLTDPNTIQAIVRLFHLSEDDHCVEIGPGLGALTQYTLPQVRQYDAFEIDADLISPLKERFQTHPHFHLHHQDALTVDWSQFKDARVIGNLPYNISTPLLFALLNASPVFRDAHFMVQKEVADRLVSPHGSADYGRLSVMAQCHAHIDTVLHVPPHAFKPQPKVDSAIVRLTPRKDYLERIQDKTLFENMVRHAFTQRRKMIRKSLQDLKVTVPVLQAAGFSGTERPETLSIEQWVALSNHIASIQ